MPVDTDIIFCSPHRINGTNIEKTPEPQKPRDDMEADNMKRCEIPIAIQLGEPTRASVHNGSGTHKMSNSTDYGIIKNNMWITAPCNWNKPNIYFVNQNPWKP